MPKGRIHGIVDASRVGLWIRACDGSGTPEASANS